MRAWMLVAVMMVMPLAGLADDHEKPWKPKPLGETVKPYVVIDAGKYQHISNSAPGDIASFRLVTMEGKYASVSLGEWSRLPAQSEAAFVLGDLFIKTFFLEVGNGGFAVRPAVGFALLDQTTDRLATRHQFHLSFHLLFDFGGIDIRAGCHHFSNGNKLHGFRRSQRNSAEEFCVIGLGARM